MKILYAIQGTGNGHICRAKEIIPYLKKHGEVDLLVSGIHSEITLPFEVKFNYQGIGFVFGKKGGIDLLNTYMKNHVNSFIKEVRSLPVEEYDIILSDFEPISSWAAYFKNRPCIALSNQCAILSKDVPKPKKEDLIGKFILNHYAPSTSEYGFHFDPHSPHIFTPIIRKEIRDLKVEELPHYTVYLPAYSDNRIIKKLSMLPKINWHLFSKNSSTTYQENNVNVYPINSKDFLESMRSCTGVLTAAGFGTTSEALYLKKKLLVIPQKQQYEQQCNAMALKKMGVPVIKQLRKRNIHKLEAWVESSEKVDVDYPDQTELIVETIVNNEYYHKDNYLEYLEHNQFNISES